jgi:hypothetical protein
MSFTEFNVVYYSAQYVKFVVARNGNTMAICEISGSHGSKYEAESLLGYSAL